VLGLSTSVPATILFAVSRNTTTPPEVTFRSPTRMARGASFGPSHTRHVHPRIGTRPGARVIAIAGYKAWAARIIAHARVNHVERSPSEGDDRVPPLRHYLGPRRQVSAGKHQEHP